VVLRLGFGLTIFWFGLILVAILLKEQLNELQFLGLGLF